jgi:hypothetical protein
VALEFLPLSQNLTQYTPVLNDERYFTLFDAFPAPTSKYYTSAEVVALVQVMRDEVKEQIYSEWVDKVNRKSATGS